MVMKYDGWCAVDKVASLHSYKEVAFPNVLFLGISYALGDIFVVLGQ